MEFLEIRKATVWRGENAALADFSLTLRHGESAAILGPNGAGKSTFLKLLAGEVRPEANPHTTCRLFGEDLWSLEELRHRIGVVMPEEVARFEDWEISSDVVLSALRGAYGRTRHMRFSEAEKSHADHAMNIMGVRHLRDRPYGALSSGEKRRFLIARAVIHDPGVLVLDEPSTALDFPSSLQLATTLRTLIHSGHTLVWVTHHPAEIPPEITRVILLKSGRLFADGPRREILTSEILSRLYDMKLKVRWSGEWCDVRFD
jgi:iron complex transport system ATP-binding protein